MNIESQRILFYVMCLSILALLGYFITYALAVYIGVCLVALFLLFAVPPLFWAVLVSALIYGGYLVHMNVVPLI
jgi:hypothetical protein